MKSYYMTAYDRQEYISSPPTKIDTRMQSDNQSKISPWDLKAWVILKLKPNPFSIPQAFNIIMQ